MKFINKVFVLPAVIASTLLAVNCKNVEKDSTLEAEEVVTAYIKKSDYGMTSDGETVSQYILGNPAGMEVAVITYGGIITHLHVPDKEGVFKDVVLGFDSLAQYEKQNPYFGAIIGRYGNRIEKGRFTLDGKEYQLPQNDGENHLHGGDKGFDKVVWQAEEIQKGDTVALKLSYLSKDGEQGYPGNLQTTVTYTLQPDNTLAVNYEATTDKKTIVNLTQHSYFNLSGDFGQKILDHEVMINADQYLPVDETLIPTGEFRDVAGTPFDFREPKKIGAEIDAENEQLTRGKGYDHCWVLNNQAAGMRIAATAYHPETGRFLEIATDEPGIQFYTGNFLDGTLPRQHTEGTYAQRTGFCLETQHYPNSPNEPDFPSTVLNPGEKYTSKTEFKFSVK